jgi:predicted acetyltransferase
MGTRTAARFAGRSSSPSITLPRPTPAPVQTGLRLSPARTGDHVNIHRLLVSVFHGPSTAEFHAQLDEPGYQPSDRVVVRDASDVVAHLRLAPQTIELEGQRLPAARFMDLATAPEYRSRGLATALLTAAERAATERGIIVGLTRTRVPKLFARLGWSVCGRHVFSTAAPRAVLAELGAATSSLPGPKPVPNSAGSNGAERVAVRPMRRVDLPAIVRLYQESAAHGRGWPVRSEAYWEWLLARGACDQVYVAATLPEPSDLAQLVNSIVGYVFVRQFRIVELVAAQSRIDVAQQLLARVCADASEQDGWVVRCDLPPQHALHDLFRCAGGELTNCRELTREVFMAKLLDPLAALRTVAPGLARRAAEAKLPRTMELGVELRGAGNGEPSGVIERYRVRVGRRAAKIATGGPSRLRVALRSSDLAPLVLGDTSAREMVMLGKLKGNSNKARQLADVLFPAGAWWRPPLDDLLV